MSITTICTNRTTDGLTDAVAALSDTQFVAMQGEFGGARVEFLATFTETPTDEDWVAVPDLILSQERSVWPICINQMPFRAPLLCARITGAGPSTNLTLYVTDGLAPAA